MRSKQVDAAHYSFGGYMTKERWISVWHQLDEVIHLKPTGVLEIGPGNGLFKQVAGLYGVPIETLDLDPELKPDHLASVTEMPFVDGAFDVVCAFQMLEHVPYEVSLRAFAEMSRVAARAVVISLPDARQVWRVSALLPRFGLRHALIPKPLRKPVEIYFAGEHYWEVNAAGYDFERIRRDFSAIRPLQRWYRVPENPYHRFMVFV